MISREEFVFTIGYDGLAAVVDGQAKRKYGHLSTAALIEKGFFRAAYASAVHSGDPAELAAAAEAYRRVAGLPASVSLDRLLGIFPTTVTRSIIL